MKRLPFSYKYLDLDLNLYSLYNNYKTIPSENIVREKIADDMLMNEFDNFIAWLWKCCLDKWYIKNDSNIKYIIFENDSDAFYYKLRWMKKIELS